jgi:hypothetical protein
MKDHNKKVEPVRFEPAAPPAVEKESRSVAQRNWVVPALSTLVILALLVFFWLPSQVDTQALEAEAAATTQLRKRAPTEQATPWSDAQLARQRKIAQEVLAELLDQQFTLEELLVEQWANDEFSAAQALATSGDEQYRQQLYLAATETYQAGLDAMLAISARVEEVFQQQLQLGLEALASDQAVAAITALELASALRPELPQPQLALDRARNLAPLLALLEQANEASKIGELEQARVLLQQARQLDPQHAGAEVQLRNIERDIARRNFNLAMTAGYQALDDARYDEAERQFLKARSILPASAETGGALQETRSARTQAQIEAFRQRGSAAEQREAWPAAVGAYQEILAIDESVVFARAGLIRSQARARLDKGLRSALEKPERLAEDAIFQGTSRLYQQALALEHKGPLLRRQLQQLNELLEVAQLPVSVLLHSDEATDVTVYKVAHLGTFRRQQLTLKPGTYTAVGVRDGYRDVRQKFTISPNGENPVIEISCTEPI